MNWKAAAGLRLPESTGDVLASIGEHRVLSAAQVHAIHFPENARRWAQKVLAYLERAGLVAYVESRRAPRRLYYLTERGADLLAAAGELDRPPKLLSPEQAGGGRCAPIRSASTKSESASCERRGSGMTNSARSAGGMRSRTR